MRKEIGDNCDILVSSGS